MKKLILISAIVFGGLMYQPAKAQIHFGLHINLGGPVYTAPAPVYGDADFYYLPDVDAYYSVSGRCYYYNDGYNWVNAACLPGRYHDYDWEHARRFEVYGPRPYMHNDEYRVRFNGVEHHDWDRVYSRPDRDYAYQQRVDHDNYYRSERPQYQQQRNDWGRNDNRYYQQVQYSHGRRDHDDHDRDGGRDRHDRF